MTNTRPDAPERLSAVVLAGGYSRRFGEEDKALARVDGEPMLQRVVNRVGAVADTVVISCREDQLAPFQSLAFEPPVSFAVDPAPDRGPLVGIHTAVDAVGAELVALVACDMPGIDPSLLDSLADRVGATDGAVPSGPDDRLQPLQAVYRRDALAAAVDQELDADRRSLHCVLDTLDLTVVAPSRLPVSEAAFVNINTKAELAAFESRSKCRQEASISQ